MPVLELKGEPTTGVAIDIIERLLPEWWGRFQPKNSAYGGVLAQGGGLGIKAFIPEINRKVAGIINQVWHGEAPQKGAEDAREKAMDLIGHLLILVSNLDAKKESGPRPGFDKAAIVDAAFGASRAARLKGEDGKAAGLAKVAEMTDPQCKFGDDCKCDDDEPREVMVQVPNSHAEMADTGQTFLTIQMPPDGFEESRDRLREDVRRAELKGFKTVEQLQAERWPNKALEDPVLPDVFCGNPRFHGPHEYQNRPDETDTVDMRCPGNMPELGIGGQEMLSNVEHNLVYLRRAFSEDEARRAGLPKNCSFEGHHRAHNWEVPAIVTGAITTYFCNGNAPYSDDSPGPERL